MSTTKSSSSTPISADPTSLVHPSTTSTGTHPITISANVIIQLRCTLNSTYAPLTIGENVVIAERVSLGPTSPAPALASTSTTTTTANTTTPISIGAYTVIESSAIVEAASIGTCCVIEAGATIGAGAVLGDGSKVCARCEVCPGEVVADGEVVFGSGTAGVNGRRVDLGVVGERKGEGLKARREAVVGLGVVLRKGWTGK